MAGEPWSQVKLHLGARICFCVTVYQFRLCFQETGLFCLGRWAIQVYKLKILQTFVYYKKGSICFSSRSAVGTFMAGRVKSILKMFWFNDWLMVSRTNYYILLAKHNPKTFFKWISYCLLDYPRKRPEKFAISSYFTYLHLCGIRPALKAY